MTVFNEEVHLVYLLKRRSDSQLYVGITMKKRMKQRFGDHKRSKRFKDCGFDYQILEESTDRSYIEKQEEYYINKYDTYQNGLNESPQGKGWGHNSSNFTTLGYVYSEESRKKMSESAKKRAEREGFNLRSKRSKENWKNPNYISKQSEVRKGKRLRPLKISDETVAEIRSLYEQEKVEIEQQLVSINKERKEKNSGWKPLTVHSEFAKKYCDHYNVSKNFIVGVVLWKTRTKILPSIYKS